jgi:hypothetical protein
MDIALVILGFIFMIVGILGSFLPILPGPPLSWVGLLLLNLTKAIPLDWWFLGVTLVIATLILAIDYIIPAIGAKEFGGSKVGMIGTTLCLAVALIFPIFGVFGIIIWPFVGAFVGEIINKADKKTALKAAFGSFLGFLMGTFLKFMVAVVYLGLFIARVWEFKTELFPYFNKIL